MADIFGDVMEWIGKAIPNEISKINSITKYIPYVGQISQILSSADTFATAYDDTGGDIIESSKAGFQGYFGSADPGKYGSDGNINRDVWNTIGQVGNLFSLGENGTGSPQVSFNKNPLSVFDNPYLFAR